MRIVLTVVGLSLIDKIKQLNDGPQIREAKQQGAPFLANYEVRDALREIEQLKAKLDNKQLRAGPLTAYADFAWLQQQQRAAGFLVDLLCQLWRSANPVAAKRKHSPAELASLSRLASPLGATDEVRLLYTESAESAVCSAILAEVLKRLSLTADFGEKGLTVTQQLLQGIQLDDQERLLREGIPTWATVLEQAQRDAARAEDRVLLNITAGYKGLAPISTLLALGLSGHKPIEVFYLYEDSDRLLYLPGSELIQFDLSIFSRFAADWQKLPDGGLARSGCAEQFTPVFIEQVIKKRTDLIEWRDEVLQLTVTGRVLFNLWRVRSETAEKPVPVAKV